MAEPNPTQEKKTKKKSKNHEYYLNIHMAWNKHPASSLSPYPDSFKFMETADGVRLLLAVDDNRVCRLVNDCAGINSILRYANYTLAPLGKPLNHAEASECYKVIRGLSSPLKEDQIKPVASKTDLSHCWHKLPWDIPLIPGPTPYFDELLSRVSIPDSFCAFIGSIFVPDSDRHQYMWVFGEGRNGKSRLASLLRYILGSSFAAEQIPDSTTKRFWTSGILGKRLVCFDDCDNFSFPSSAFFKGLTGADSQRIEQKGQPIYTAEINAKFLFFSNKQLEINSSVADQRRALYASIEAFSGAPMPTNIYDKRLREEAPDILAKCLLKYEELTHDRGPIESAEMVKAVKDLAEMGEEHLDALVTARFTPEPGQHVLSHDMQQWFREQRMNRRDASEMRDFMKRKYGVERATISLAGTKVKVYKNIALKNSSF